MTFSTAFATAGESSWRIARIVMLTMFGMIPVHFFVPCEASGIIAGVALVLLFVTGILSIVARKFSPFGWALVAMLLHGISMH